MKTRTQVLIGVALLVVLLAVLDTVIGNNSKDNTETGSEIVIVELSEAVAGDMVEVDGQVGEMLENGTILVEPELEIEESGTVPLEEIYCGELNKGETIFHEEASEMIYC